MNIFSQSLYKKVVLFLMLLSFSLSFGQETYRTRYKIRKFVPFKHADTVFLVRQKEVKFEDLSESEKNKLKKGFKNGEKLRISEEKTIGEKKYIINKEVVIGEEFWNKMMVMKEVKFDVKHVYHGYVKFDEDKLYFNPYIRRKYRDSIDSKDSLLISQGDKDGYIRDVYYYKLRNRQTIELKFDEFTFSGLVIPFKYRLPKKKDERKEDFSASFNANLFGGYTFCGRSKFSRREKVENKINTVKWTAGAFVGTSTVELNSANTTSAGENALEENEKFNKGLASLGFGINFSYNKLSIAGFLGWDFAVGNKSNLWDYDGKPYLGVGFGYNIFKI